MGDTTHHTDDGRQKIYVTHRPHGMTTYFAGDGDDVSGNTIGGGERLLWQMKIADSSKTVDITFIEDIYLKDGYIIVRNAPFGAYLDIEVIHPVAGVVGSFGRKIPLLASGWFPLDTEDRGYIPVGLTVRLTVHNSSGAANGEDEPTDFDVAGRIELFRTNTV